MYGDPHDTPDGATVIPVARVRTIPRPTATPVGIFVIHAGEARWVPAVDGTWPALLSGVAGLVTGILGTLAVLRRRPRASRRR